MRVMGLDASSATIGYSIVDVMDDNIKLAYSNFFKPPKDGNLFDRLSKTQKIISNILKEYNPDVVAIEEITKFMAGASTATTIITLAVFNRAVGLSCLEFLGHPPGLFNVMKIRHGLKFNKELPKKEEIPELVATHLNIKFPYIEKNGERIKENFDVADSIAVALFTVKRIKELEVDLQKVFSKTIPTDKKLLKKFNIKAIPLKTEYEELTGKEWNLKRQ